MKIKHMLIFLFSIMSIFPIVTVGILSYFSAKGIIEREQIHGMSVALSSKCNHIKSSIQAQHKIAKIISGSFTAQSLSAHGKNEAGILRQLQISVDNVYNAINYKDVTGQKGDSSAYVISISVYDANGGEIAHSENKLKHEKINSATWQQLQENANSSCHVNFDSTAGKTEIILYEKINNKKGEFIGLIKMKLSTKLLDDVVLQHDGLGKTGEYYLVQLYNNKLKFITPLRDNFSVTEARLLENGDISANKAVFGTAGSGLSKNYKGEKTYSVWDNIPDLGLGIVGDIAQEEAMKPVFNLRDSVIWIGLGELILSILFAIFYSRIFSEPIARLVRAFKKISHGELDEQIRINNTGIYRFLNCVEYKLLSLAGNESIIYLKNVVNHAKALDSGNYTVNIEPKSNRDELGVALKKMTENLRNYDRTSKETIWLQKGIADLNDKIKGEHLPQQLATNILYQLMPYLPAQMGAIYLKGDGEDNLKIASGYAFKPEEKNSYIKIGEGLLGQAAKQKQTILLSDVPDNYIYITSSLGSTKPRNIIFIPLLENDKLMGVMEIAFVAEISKCQLELLNSIKDDIAIAFETTESRLRINMLLSESQKQSEELAAQSEELRVQQEELMETNVNLELQAEKLKASDEELRVQQEELMESNQELEEKTQLLEEKNQAVNQKNEELQVVGRELERKAELLAMSSKYKSEFLANMSHELRTPLNSILLLSRLLADNYDNNLNDEQIEFANVINNSGNGLLELINQVLDLSKIEAGKMDVNFDDLEIKTICKSINSIFEPITKDKGLNYVLEKSPNIPDMIIADRIRVEQVLKNLLSNAIKFTEKGGTITFKIYSPDETEKKKLKNKCEQMMAFSVSDTGIGIPEDKLELVFEAFRQVDGSTHRKYGGTGLGLSISKEIAHMLAGDLTVTSKIGEGSTFTLYLPIDCREEIERQKKVELGVEEKHEDKIREITTTQNVRPIIDTKALTEIDKNVVSVTPEEILDDRNRIDTWDRTILIVEDDVNFAQVLIKFSHDKGYKAIVAVSGANAIPYATKYKPAGILLDIQLPVKSGWTILKELKADPQLSSIPVHMMSSMEVKAKESIEAGAIDFMNKSVSKKDLDEVFNRIEKMNGENPKTILLVEDNEMHLGAMKIFLSTASKTCLTARSAKEAYNLLENESVDCVVLDLGLPDATGFEVLEKIKKQEKFSKLPIIIYTGASLSLKEEQQIKQYANAIVMKTVDSYKRLMNEVKLFLHVIEDPNEEKLHKKPYLKNEVLSGKKILLADDDNRNIFSLTKVLELQQMIVLPAIDGKDALRSLEANSEVEVILMDMMMPEMDGYETIRKIRENPKWDDIPIISITAKTMLGDREKCIEAGASDYISKPIDTDQLLSLLRVWLFK